MKNTAIASTYARALITPDLGDAAMKKKLEDINTAAQAVNGTESVRRFFASPQVPNETKQAVLQKTLKGIDKDVANLLSLLIEKNRFDNLSGIIKECQKLIDQKQGNLIGTLSTAFPIDKADLDLICGKLEKHYKKNILIKTKTDPGLIAGGVLIIGNERIDFSVKGKLEKLKNDLITMPLAKKEPT